MLKVQRAVGLLLVALGGAYEASALSNGLPSLAAGLPDSLIAARCAAVFGAALYSLTMTGRLTDALTAVLPVPVLAPAAAVLLAWKRGDLSRAAPAPRRVVSLGEAFALAFALAGAGWSASAYGPSLFGALPALAREAPAAPVRPAPTTPLLPDQSVGSVLYQVTFRPGQSDLDADARSLLGRVTDTMHYYPLDDLLLSADVPAADRDARGLAQSRLQAVLNQLVASGLDRRRIRTQIFEGGGPPGTVDVLILSN